MMAKIKVGTNMAEYKVVQILVNPITDVVETVYISPITNPLSQSRLVIVNGIWQVWGYAPDHTIEFV